MVEVGDLDPLTLGQEPATDLTDREPFKRRHEPDHLTASVDLVATDPVRPRAPRHTHLSGGRPDAPAPLSQLHEPLTLGRQRTTPRPLLHTTR